MNKNALYDLFVRFCGDEFIRCIRKAPCVLFYHGVADHPNPRIETESISVRDFRKQMDYLKQNYHVISIREFNQKFKYNKWDNDEILLTFDDGYENMLTTALPILEEYDFPFLLFLTTNNIDHGELFATTVNRLVVLASSLQHIKLPSCNINAELTPSSRIFISNQISRLLKTKPLKEVVSIVEDLYSQISENEMNDLREQYPSVNPMNWEEAKQISKSALCTIGSHGLDHICCHENQDIKDVERQILDSKRLIENNLNIPCDYFSYPNGNYTEESNEMVKKFGYLLGFSTKRLSVNALTPCNIPRLYVPYHYARFVYSLVTYPG